MIKRMVFILPILILGTLVCKPQYSSAAELTTFFNQQWLKTVVSIEMINDKKEIKPIGTSFLIQTDNNHILLVSAKHVVSDEDLVEAGGGSWFLSKSADVAVRFMYRYPDSDVMTIPQNMFLKDENVQPGTPSLILGFPMGLRSDDYAIPILRSSLVALKAPNYYMLDVLHFRETVVAQ